MIRWHRTEADKSWPIHATVDAENSDKGELEWGGGGVPIQLWTNVESKWYMVWQGTGSTKRGACSSTVMP